MNDRDYQDWLESEYSFDELAELEQAEYEAYLNHVQMSDEELENLPF